MEGLVIVGDCGGFCSDLKRRSCAAGVLLAKLAVVASFLRVTPEPKRLSAETADVDLV
jgi:hypothetical protein